MIEVVDLIIWDRAFSLPVVYDCYKDEIVKNEQIEAVWRFVKNPEWIDKSKEYVEFYCKEDVYQDVDNEKKDNIFSYIKPECLFVKRDNDKPRVALMCKYRYDPEHGLAIIFTYEGDIVIGLQDLIL